MASQFEVRHILPCTPQVFWERLHGSVEFNESLYIKELGHQYEFLVNDPASGRLRTRMFPKVTLPDVLKKAAGMGAEGFYLEEDGVLDRSTMTYRFTIHPSMFRDKADVRGEMQLFPEGEGKTLRVVKFQLEVRAFGVGKIVESFVEKTVKAGYDESYAFTETYLERIGLKTG